MGELYQKLRAFVQRKLDEHEAQPKEEKDPKEPYYSTDRFWLTRWIRDIRYKRVGLTTITWLGEEYGYRSDYERVPKKQLEFMRQSMPFPMHRSNAGWKEWVLVRDDHLTPFPEVSPNEDGFYQPTAIDLHLYMTNKSLDNALTFRKKNVIPMDGKMLLLCAGIVVVVVFIILRSFA